MINLAKNGSSRGAFFLCTAWPWWLVYLKSRLYVPMLISHHFRGAAGPKFNKFVTGLAKYSIKGVRVVMWYEAGILSQQPWFNHRKNPIHVPA